LATKKKVTKKKEKSFEETLWDAANKLRGSVESSEYKHIVLSLIFLKFISDTFEKQRQKLIDAGLEKHIDMVPAYTKDNVFYLPPESRWSFVQQNAKQEDIALKIDTALSTIEKTNKALQGALPKNYFSQLEFDTSKLAALVDVVDNIETLNSPHKDIVGRVYEYFLAKFAIAEGKGKGEFYTPKSVVNLIAELIEPYRGKIYDPCCGSGGMFVQSMKFIKNHKGNTKDVAIYGQEATPTTFKLAKMNLAIRGISANLGVAAKDTFAKDQHELLKADFIMANPPFNQKDWRDSSELLDDKRWSGFDVPPVSNANYGWILHMVSKLSENGIAGFILSSGSTSASGNEYKIRKQLIENNLIEAIITLPRDMFYNTDISVTLWILNKNKEAKAHQAEEGIVNLRARSEEVLFMDLRRLGSEFEKKYIELTDKDIKDVSSIFHNWQRGDRFDNYKNKVEFCYSASKKEIIKKDYSLVPSKYIPFSATDSKIDFETEMLTIQSQLSALMKEEKKAQEELFEAFKGIGYEI